MGLEGLLIALSQQVLLVRCWESHPDPRVADKRHVFVSDVTYFSENRPLAASATEPSPGRNGKVRH